MSVKKYNKSSGISIALVLIIILVVSVIGLAISAVGMRDLNFVNKDKYNTRAFYAAEAGLARGIAKSRADLTWDGTVSEQDTTLTYNEVKLESSDDTYTVQIWNNYSGSQDMAGFKDVVVPPGYAYIVSTGRVGTTANERAAKHVGTMLKKGTPFDEFGLFGDDSVRFNGNINIDAYDSSTGQNLSGEGDTGTNGNQQGAITINGSAASIDGSLWVGPGSILGTNGAITVTGHPSITGDEEILPQEIPMPDVQIPSGLPQMVLPSSVSHIRTYIAYSSKYLSEKGKYKFAHLSSRAPGGGGGGGSTTIPLAPGQYSGTLNVSNHQEVVLTGPGTYVFDGINIAAQGEIQVNTTGGPVKIYLNGDMKLTGGSSTGSIYNDHDGGAPKPTDLLIYGTQNCTTLDLTGNSEAYLGVYAPNAEINMRGNAELYGALVGETIWVHGHPDFHYDVALGRLADDIRVISVVSWQRY
ncbi:MAG: pilus assembly PilX N-terminal domain-containing protein [Candidatus Eremiobacteraeota bacterium]|nr:pilus assembly PilX N-terminal domain-containing protein [Candidatus Eremiobacteraeota bacterium]